MRARRRSAPEQVNHRRYEALRAYFLDGATYAQAGQRFGYTPVGDDQPGARVACRETDVVRPAPQARPAARVGSAKDRARGRVISCAATDCPPTRSPRGWRSRAPR